MELRHRAVAVVVAVICAGLSGCGDGEDRTSSSSPAGSCLPPSATCPDGCADLESDPSHCGSCDVACVAGAVCSQGKCAGGCAAGETSCSGSCVDLDTNPLHCGKCEAACAADQVCTSGKCASACGLGTQSCNGVCVDSAVDPKNCGGCGVACAVGEVCTAGKCSVACGPKMMVCDGQCTDGSVDPANCGDCGIACVVGETCVEGMCTLVCPVGFESCGGKCVDVALDPNNCGACANTCSSGLCSAGKCGPTCTGGATDCGGVCVDTATDPKHCGGCASACPAGQNCVNGTCTLCSAGYTACNGVCKLLSTDGANCGACGNACPYPPNGLPACTNGVCGAKCYSYYADCDSTKPGCETSVSNDPKNCGACGVACGSNAYCSYGKCLTCGAGTTVCNGYCVNLATDLYNCGGCGTKCPWAGPGATSSCSNGVCGMQCYPGHVNCDGSWTNGCEIDVQSDLDNCGTCGVVCGSNQICQSATCLSCPTGKTACGNNCVSTSTDAYNCGGCGAICVSGLLHASSQCQNGTCSLVCEAGYFDCDGNSLSGCETKTGPSNCGACGNACASGQFCLKGTACKTCSAIDLGSSIPQTTTGTTIGKADSFTPSCSYGNSPDVYFSFTAPATDSYTFDTVGSAFDTVLQVLDGTCGGAKLGCDDDSGGGTASKLSLQLTANQTVIVVVDGKNSSQGAFKLNLH